ncbi:prohead protease/major capsid protein fusion protein [Frigidibacter sp.]|uniref:prohead protease/major capsid protein fusion protein n=1 Tax=Frigidibacter sp. TaxID=2586418 RepID=UPI002732DF2E|nr:prohead protease/major capsid protein fusion protein [Frigidibacter sp.]MDP3341499.1 Mu-like prophage major head subunit gpT family protein [Frigidibacter sp.]
MPEDMIRSVEFRKNSYDAQSRTFEAVIATETPVLRHDAQGPYLEILPAEAFDLSNQNLPLLDSHNTGTVRAILGRTESIRRADQQIVATIRLSAAEDVAPIGQRIADGTLDGVSIGYRATGWITRREGAQRIRTAGSVVPREVTLTSNPADPNSGVRQQQEAAVPKDNIEDGRAALIQRVRAAHNLPEDFQTRMEEAGEEIGDDEIRQAGRDEAAAIRAAKPEPVRLRFQTGATDEEMVAFLRERRAEALACRMTGEAPSEAARPFMAMGLQDFAREALATAGVAVRSLGAEEVMTRAMHGTSDFPELLTASGNRVLASGYQAAQSPLKALARQRTMSDFRATSILKLGEFSGLQKVTESGEIKAMTTGEAKEGYALDTFGGTFALSRKAIINDDLGGFGRWSEMMGRAAAETEAKQLMALLTVNAGGGVKLGDGVNLFHADHGNLAAAGAALSETSLSAARLALRTQKGLDGKTPVNVVPKFLLVGPALETTAEKLLATINATTTGDVNPFGGKLTLLVEPRITTTAWYVFADPATAPVLEYAYLSSAPGPQLSSRDGWEVLGREFRVVLDFGCGAVDHRGAYRNAGV